MIVSIGHFPAFYAYHTAVGLSYFVVVFLWWIDNHEQGSVVAIGGMTDAGDGELCRIFLLLLLTRYF